MSGVLPALVPDEHLQGTNSVNNFFSNGAIILGAAVGGIIVAGWGATWALAIDAATFTIGGIVLLTFRHVSPASGKTENTMIDDLIHGWKLFLSFRWIVIGVFGFSFIVLAWAAGENILGPLIALKEFNGAKSWYRFGGIGLQPSEFAKAFTALALAKLMSDRKYNLNILKNQLKAFIIIFLPAFLIDLNNHLQKQMIACTLF